MVRDIEFSTFVATPHEYLKAEILARGFHDQSDASLLEVIERMEYETALLVAHVLDTKIRNGFDITDEELAIFILQEGGATVLEQSMTIN